MFRFLGDEEFERSAIGFLLLPGLADKMAPAATFAELEMRE